MARIGNAGGVKSGLGVGIGDDQVKSVIDQCPTRAARLVIGDDLAQVAVAMLPYLVALFALLFVLIIVPDITRYLPRALGFSQ